jgi:TRAP-type C4-dicarboxylate transport system substrate-binding protein
MKHGKIYCCLVLCFLTAGWIAASTVSAAEKTIVLRYSTFFPPGHPHTVLSEQWCKEVEKRTNGKVKVNHHPGATLTSPQQTYDSILDGVIDVGLCVLGYTMGKFPLSEVLSYPLGVPSGSMATGLVNEYFAKFKPAEFNNVKVMYFQANGPGLIHTRKLVEKMEDMKGLKIRTFGPTSAFVTNLGAAPVAMPMGDAYDAISRGVVDGIYVPYEALVGWKLGEVVKYTVENFGSAYSGVQMVAMNKNKWNSLPPDAQKAIEAINQEWINKQGKMWDDLDKDGKDFAIKRGNKIITLSKEEDARWAAKTQPVFDEYVKRMKDKNLPGDEVVKFYRDRLKGAKK